MDNRIGECPSPKSTDLDGWRQAIAESRLRSFRLEDIVAAFQDLGPRDKDIQHVLAKYLSDSILRILGGLVGPNHPNRGHDIIFRAHHQIFVALMRPTSADGRGLRQAFFPRVAFRMKDAIVAEQRERRSFGYGKFNNSTHPCSLCSVKAKTCMTRCLNNWWRLRQLDIEEQLTRQATTSAGRFLTNKRNGRVFGFSINSPT